MSSLTIGSQVFCLLVLTMPLNHRCGKLFSPIHTITTCLMIMMPSPFLMIGLIPDSKMSLTTTSTSSTDSFTAPVLSLQRETENVSSSKPVDNPTLTPNTLPPLDPTLTPGGLPDASVLSPARDPTSAVPSPAQDPTPSFPSSEPHPVRRSTRTQTAPIRWGYDEMHGAKYKSIFLCSCG